MGHARQLELEAPFGRPLADLPHDHADGGIECRFYIQIAGIQQEGVGGRPHGGAFAAGVALIAAADIGQHGLVGDGLRLGLAFHEAAPGAHLGPAVT